MVEVVEASKDDTAQWEEFLAQSNNGTLFHSLAFLSYHEPDRADVRGLIFRDSGRLLALLPGAWVDRDEERVFVSPWGASFGGWVLRGNESFERTDALVDSLVGWCREGGADAVEIALPPTFYLREPNQLVEFVLLTRGFRRRGCDVTDVIPLAGGMEAVRERWEASARKGVRRAREEGVAVGESDDVERFYPILEANRRRHGAVPTHSADEIRRLFDRVPASMKILLAERNGEAVGGSLLFRCNDRVVLNFYLCHRDEAGAARPADGVMARSIEAAVDWGASYYDLGTSSLGGEPNPGLMRFKGKWGSVAFLRERFRLEMPRRD